MTITKLFFCTEASRTIGIGHLMRCFALAEEAYQLGLRSHFFLIEVIPSLIHRIESIDSTWEVTTINFDEYCLQHPTTKQDWWIIDSYKATAEFITKLRKKNRVMVLDDLGSLMFYDCDLIVNAAPRACKLDYERRSIKSKLLAGPKFSLIRSEFRNAIRPIPGIRSGVIGIMIGGSDPHGLTELVLRALHRTLHQYQFLVIMGASSPNQQKIQTLGQELGRVDLKIDPPDLAKELQKPDLVITAAGGSIGELCAIGQMAVALVVADNQVGALADCPYPTLDCRKGLTDVFQSTVNNILFASDDNIEIRQQAQCLIDGNGCQRILHEMLVD